MEEKKSFFNKFKMPIIIGISAVLVILIILLVVLNNGGKKNLAKIDKKEDIAKVSNLLSVKYDDIACVSGCEYFIALSGDELTGKIDFLDKSGNKKGNLDLSKMDPKLVATLDVEEMTDSYYIVSYSDLKDFDTKYAAYSYNGKQLMTGSDMEALTDSYFLVTIDVFDTEKDIIYTSKGKEAYNDVKSVYVYNNEYITFKQNDVSKIVDNNGKELLSGYKLSDAIMDENDNIKYLIVKSDSDNVYNYYDIKSNSKKGDAFTSYRKDENKVIITKDVNSERKQFVLDDNGMQSEYKDEDNDSDVDVKDNYYEEVKNNFDSEKYPAFAKVIKSADQKYILVNGEENNFGILNVDTSEFTELGKYKENSSKRLTITNLNSSDKSINSIFVIECSTYYCDFDQQYVYDFSTNKLLISRGQDETKIDDLCIYDDGYMVVENEYSSNEDSSMYILYDKDMNKILESDDDIQLIDKSLKYYTYISSLYGSVNLYSVKDSKVLNTNGSKLYDIDYMTFNGEKVYYFNSDNKLNILNSDNTISSIEGSFRKSDDVGLYLVGNDGKKLIYHNMLTGQSSSYELKENESNNSSNATEMVPYRNTYFINNSYDVYMKVVGSNGKDLINKKGLQIYKIKRKDNGSVVIFVKDKNDKIGAYIAE